MLISNAELKSKLGTKQDAQVIKWLNENHVKWLRDKNRRPITTISAIERVLFKESGDEVSF